MAGQPVYRRLLAEIGAQGGPEAIFNRFTDGETVVSVARSLGVSTATLYKWRDKEGLREAWETAMADAAEAHMGKGYAKLEALENLHVDDLTGPRVQLASLQSGWHMKMAGIRNPKFSGKGDGVQVNVNFGDAFLASLSKRENQIRPPIEEAHFSLPAEPAQLVEGE